MIKYKKKQINEIDTHPPTETTRKKERSIEKWNR